jgi:hypothetical protein
LLLFNGPRSLAANIFAPANLIPDAVGFARKSAAAKGHSTPERLTRLAETPTDRQKRGDDKRRPVFMSRLCRRRGFGMDPLRDLAAIFPTKHRAGARKARAARPMLCTKSDDMTNNQRHDAEEARQWAITFRLMTLAIALAGLIMGVLAIRG